MAVIHEQTILARDHFLECKQCHRLIGHSETVAYHLVEKVLYGWCETCFGKGPDGWGHKRS